VDTWVAVLSTQTAVCLAGCLSWRCVIYTWTASATGTEHMSRTFHVHVPHCGRGQLKCDDAHKPDFVFRRNGRVHLNWRGRQLSPLLAAEFCASAVVMLDTPCSEVVWRVLATYSIRQFLLHFPSCASPCAITFQLDSTDIYTFDRLFANPYRTNKSTVPLLCISLSHVSAELPISGS